MARNDQRTPSHPNDPNPPRKKPGIVPLVVGILIAIILLYFLFSMLTGDNETVATRSEPAIQEDVGTGLSNDPTITSDAASETPSAEAPARETATSPIGEVDADPASTEDANAGVMEETMTVDIAEPSETPAGNAGTGGNVEADTDTATVPLQEPIASPAN